MDTSQDLKAGHPPAQKVGGVRVPAPTPSTITPAKRDDDATSPPETAGPHAARDLDSEAQLNHEHQLELQQKHLQDLVAKDIQAAVREDKKKQFYNTKPETQWKEGPNVKNHAHQF